MPATEARTTFTRELHINASRETVFSYFTDPAKIPINPTATAMFPFAIAAKGGPYGAPGQTARMRNPAATIGWASNRNNKPTVAAGTQT